MADYIKRTDVIKLARIYDSSDFCVMAVTVKDIRNIPSADVAEVRHGKWIRPTRVPDSMLSECSICGFDTGAFTFKYCPNCGADMREES